VGISRFPSQLEWDTADEIHIFIATHHALLSKSNKDDTFMDSGCSHDMCPHRSWFTTFTPLDKPIIIHIGDASIMRAVGIGSIQFQMDTPTGIVNTVFPHVLYVPELAATLISMSKRTDGNKHYFVRKGDDLFIHASKTNCIVADGHKQITPIFFTILSISWLGPITR
jgi:hypothetical protein